MFDLRENNRSINPNIVRTNEAAEVKQLLSEVSKICRQVSWRHATAEIWTESYNSVPLSDVFTNLNYRKFAVILILKSKLSLIQRKNVVNGRQLERLVGIIDRTDIVVQSRQRDWETQNNKRTALWNGATVISSSGFYRDWRTRSLF